MRLLRESWTDVSGRAGQRFLDSPLLVKYQTHLL